MTLTNEQIQAPQAADPERIDACVKACDGISTENLTNNVPLKQGLSGLNQRIRDAEAQRDKLLADREADKALIAELQSENEYIRKRFKESDLMFGKNILVMQAAIIEWQGTGDAKKGLAWIYNTLFGPGELPDEAEKDAQAYFDSKYAPLDEELMALHQWFWAQSEAERAAAGITLVVGGEDATNSR